METSAPIEGNLAAVDLERRAVGDDREGGERGEGGDDRREQVERLVGARGHRRLPS